MTTVFTAMQPTHLDAVWRIECAAHSHPWAESLVRDLTSRGACHQVMLVDQQVVGYFYAQNIVGEVTLLNIAVDPAQQGKVMVSSFCSTLLRCVNSKKQKAHG